jgi:hypothetical protein
VVKEHVSLSILKHQGLGNVKTRDEAAKRVLIVVQAHAKEINALKIIFVKIA